MQAAKALFEGILSKGMKYFDALQVDQPVEDGILDFKESTTRAGSKALSSDDRKNMSKAVGGFANTAGGVIVWGVKCSKDNNDGPDIVRAVPGVPDVLLLETLLQNQIYCTTEPPVDGIEFHRVYKDNTNTDEGFLIMHVPATNGLPVMSAHSDLARTFFMRAGACFFPMPHSLVADRFGRRPQPDLQLVARVSNNHPNGGILHFDVANTGRGMARYICAQIQINFGWHMMGENIWSSPSLYRIDDWAIDSRARIFESDSDVIIHPNCAAPVVSFHYKHGATAFPDFPTPVIVKYRLFCEGFQCQRELVFDIFISHDLPLIRERQPLKEAP